MAYETFAGCALMKGVAPADVRRIYDAGLVKTFAPGQTVIAEGEINTNLFVVLRGGVEVCLPDRDDRFTPVKLARLGPGSCVGEYSFIDEHPASAAVVALEKTELFVLSNERLSRVVAGAMSLERTLYRNLLVLMIERLRENNAVLDMIRPQKR